MMADMRVIEVRRNGSRVLVNRPAPKRVSLNMSAHKVPGWLSAPR